MLYKLLAGILTNVASTLVATIFSILANFLWSVQDLESLRRGALARMSNTMDVSDSIRYPIPFTTTTNMTPLFSRIMVSC